MTDAQALNHLILAARNMLQTGCEFARRDSPEAFAAVCQEIGRNMLPRIEISLGNPVTVRAIAVDPDGEEIAQLFEMTARISRTQGDTGKGAH